LFSYSTEGLTEICGCVQALIASSSLIDSCGNGGDKNSIDPDSSLSFIRAGKTKIVFLSTGSLTLLAISKEGSYITEAYMRIQLEYVYSQIIFALTIQIQDIFEKDPGFDLRSKLGSTDEIIINRILDEANNNVGCFLLSSIEIIPLPYKIREDTSNIISSVCQKFSALFAFILCQGRFVSIAQPKSKSSHLCGSDLLLIINFVKSQPSLTTNESWFPLCLPRFHASAFVQAYACCLNEETGLSLILVSEKKTLEQFEHLRSAASVIRMELDIPQDLSKSEHIISSDLIPASDQQEQRNSLNEGKNIDHLGEKSPLILAIFNATNETTLNALYSNYCNIAMAMHFLFRFDVSISSSHINTTGHADSSTKLSQIFSPPLGFPFVSNSSKQHVWSVYQRLALRLRLGSTSVESSMAAYKDLENIDENDEGIQKDCLAIRLLETSPNVHGVTYLLQGTELFIGLNGDFFELFAVLPATTSPKHGCQVCTKLVRKLMGDAKNLFIFNPPTFRL